MLLLCVSAITAVAQSATVQANIVVTTQFDPRVDYLVFDVEVTRVSEDWLLWSNATLRLLANDATGVVTLDSTLYSIAYVPATSVLPIVPYTPGAMAGFAIDPQLDTSFISIAVHGPDSASSAFIMPQTNNPYRIGRFEIHRLDGTPAPSFVSIVLSRGERYQAHAFKMDHDSVTGTAAEREVWYQNHDNVEMLTAYSYTQRGAPCTELKVTEFTGDYIGDLKISLRFVAECELFTEGFFFERAIVQDANPTVLAFQPLPLLTYLTNPALIACSTCVAPTVYANFIDPVLYRRTLYAYRIASVKKITGEIVYHDTVFVRIPNSVISNAAILENPFKDRTAVQFNVDDRLKLTAAAYDLGGRLLRYLTDENGNEIINLEYAQGVKFLAKFDASDIASQGLYNIILIATPIDDLSIEQLSRVVLKAQLLR